MWCGQQQFLSAAAPAASLRTCPPLRPLAGAIRSPYYTLLTLCHGMAAIAAAQHQPVDDEDIFLDLTDQSELTAKLIVDESL